MNFNQKLLIHTSIELFNHGNLDIIEQVFLPNYYATSNGKKYLGQEFIRKFIIKLRKTFPDIRVKKIKFLALDQQTLVWFRTFIGTQKLPMKGIPPSTKPITWSEMIATNFINQKIASDLIVSELKGEMLAKKI